MENQKIKEYQKNLKLYQNSEESWQKRYKACRKLKRYLKGLDVAIEKRKKTHRASAFQIDDNSLKNLYQDIYF